MGTSGDHWYVFTGGALVTPALGLGRGSVGCAGPWFSGPNGDFTLVIRVSLASLGLFVTPPLVIGISLALGLLVNDSSCVCGESALTSAGASASDPV